MLHQRVARIDRTKKSITHRRRSTRALTIMRIAITRAIASPDPRAHLIGEVALDGWALP